MAPARGLFATSHRWHCHVQLLLQRMLQCCSITFDRHTMLTMRPWYRRSPRRRSWRAGFGGRCRGRRCWAGCCGRRRGAGAPCAVRIKLLLHSLYFCRLKQSLDLCRCGKGGQPCQPAKRLSEERTWPPVQARCSWATGRTTAARSAACWRGPSRQVPLAASMVFTIQKLFDASARQHVSSPAHGTWNDLPPAADLKGPGPRLCQMVGECRVPVHPSKRHTCCRHQSGLQMSSQSSKAATVLANWRAGGPGHGDTGSPGCTVTRVRCP